MEIKPKNLCPQDNFNPCRGLDCAWFTQMRGMNPNTGKDIDEWGCAIAWLPVLLVENSQQQRHTGAAVESFRNEMVKNNEVGQRVLLAAAGFNQNQQSLILDNKE